MSKNVNKPGEKSHRTQFFLQLKATLTRKQLLVLLLREICELKFEEIGWLLRLDRGDAHHHYRRAEAKIRQQNLLI